MSFLEISLDAVPHGYLCAAEYADMGAPFCSFMNEHMPGSDGSRQCYPDLYRVCYLDASVWTKHRLADSGFSAFCVAFSQRCGTGVVLWLTALLALFYFFELLRL